MLFPVSVAASNSDPLGAGLAVEVHQFCPWFAIISSFAALGVKHPPHVVNEVT